MSDCGYCEYQGGCALCETCIDNKHFTNAEQEITNGTNES